MEQLLLLHPQTPKSSQEGRSLTAPLRVSLTLSPTLSGWLPPTWPLQLLHEQVAHRKKKFSLGLKMGTKTGEKRI